MRTELGSWRSAWRRVGEVGKAEVEVEEAEARRRARRTASRGGGGGRGGEEILKGCFHFCSLPVPLPCPPVLPLCVHKLLCLKTSLCTSISMQERLCVKASVGSVKASVYKSVLLPFLPYVPPLVPLFPPCSRVPAPSPLSLSVPLIKTRTKSLLFFMFCSCSLPLPPLPCSPPVPPLFF